MPLTGSFVWWGLMILAAFLLCVIVFVGLFFLADLFWFLVDRFTSFFKKRTSVEKLVMRPKNTLLSQDIISEPIEMDIIRQAAQESGTAIGAFLSTGGRTSHILLNGGDTTHKHQFKEGEWNEEVLGTRSIDGDSFYMTFQTFFRCSCGAEEIFIERSFV